MKHLFFVSLSLLSTLSLAAPDLSEDAILIESCKDFNISSYEILNTPEKIDSLVLAHYRQNTPKIIDPVADYLITQFVDRAYKSISGKKKPISPEISKQAEKCAGVLFGIDTTPEELIYVNKDFYKESPKYVEDREMLEEILTKYTDDERQMILDRFESGNLIVESHLSPINPAELASKIVSIIEEEEKNGVAFKKGEKHRWSPYFKQKRGLISDERMKSLFSKILMTLAGGKSSHVLITGKEAELKQELESMPDRSVTPEELFRLSYKKAEGDLYKTLLTIENVLSAHWRTPNRQQLLLTTKLKPFSRVFGSEGDVFGHWYHLFGITFFGSVEGKTMALFAAKTESVGSLILSKGKGEKQENLINSRGAVAGSYLKKYADAKEEGREYELPEIKKAKKDDMRKRVEEAVKNIIKDSKKKKKATA